MSDNDRSERTRDEVKAVLGIGDERRMRMRRWTSWAVTALFVVLVVTAGYYLISGSLSGPTLQYRTDAVRRGDITVLVTATGTVEPTNTVEISSELSGIIREVNVDYNSRVEAGEVLAELDTDKLEAAVASSRARLQAAKAQVVDRSGRSERCSDGLERGTTVLSFVGRRGRRTEPSGATTPQPARVEGSQPARTDRLRAAGLGPA